MGDLSRIWDRNGRDPDPIRRRYAERQDKNGAWVIDVYDDGVVVTTKLLPWDATGASAKEHVTRLQRAEHGKHIVVEP